MSKLKPYLALPLATAIIGGAALAWLSATVAAVCLIAAAISFGATAAAQDSASSASVSNQPTAVIVPGVWPEQNHEISWDQHVAPKEQILFMFNTVKAADTAGAVVTSSAWAPTADQRQAVLIAWTACKMDGHGRFAISKRWGGQITEADCSAWWSGSDQTLSPFKGWD